MASEPIMGATARLGEAAGRRRWPAFRLVRPTHVAAEPNPAGGVVEHAPQRDAILRMIAAALDGIPRPEPWHDRNLDWDAVIAVAADGRLLTHVCHGATICGMDPPARLRDAARAFRARALAINSVNLTTTQRVCAALDASAINFVVLKGPMQLQALYGDYFVRPSSDLDLLVDNHAYDRAARVLNGLGYAAAARCESRWWRHYLGEQHFIAADAGLSTVDLHHRVQQPGCPAPRELATYIGTAHRAPLGRAEVPVLSGIHACLLSAISFVKAAYHRETSMRYLCDLAMMLRAMTDDDRARLLDVARAQGICRLLLFAWAAAAALLPMDLPRVRTQQAPLLERGVMAAIALTPGNDRIAWPKRRRLLWHLCDADGMASRIGSFGREAWFAAAAELSRLQNADSLE